MEKLQTVSTEHTQPGAGEAPQSPPDPAAVRHALQVMKKAASRDALLPKSMNTNLILSAALLISLAANCVQYHQAAQVKREYFATDNGRLVRLAPTSQPAWSNTDVIAYGSSCIMQAFNLDFVHFKAQMSAVQPCFSDDGHRAYVRALQQSNIFSALQDDRMNLSVIVGAPTITRSGQMTDGTVAWQIHYPVRMRLVGQKTSRPERAFIFELTVRRTDTSVKPSGLEIHRIITKDAPPNS